MSTHSTPGHLSLLQWRGATSLRSFIFFLDTSLESVLWSVLQFLCWIYCKHKKKVMQNLLRTDFREKYVKKKKELFERECKKKKKNPWINIFTTMSGKQINKEPHPWVSGSKTLLVNCYSKSDHLLTIPFSPQERLHWQWLLLGHRVKLTSRLSPSRTIKSWTMRDTVNKSYFNLPWAQAGRFRPLSSLQQIWPSLKFMWKWKGKGKLWPCQILTMLLILITGIWKLNGLGLVRQFVPGKKMI